MIASEVASYLRKRKSINYSEEDYFKLIDETIDQLDQDYESHPPTAAADEKQRAVRDKGKKSASKARETTGDMSDDEDDSAEEGEEEGGRRELLLESSGKVCLLSARLLSPHAHAVFLRSVCCGDSYQRCVSVVTACSSSPR